MTHPLESALRQHKTATHLLGDLTGGKPRACVTVRREGNNLVVYPVQGIGALKADTEVMPLVDGVRVVDPERGRPIAPSKGSAFYITVATFDPFHLVCELPKR